MANNSYNQDKSNNTNLKNKGEMNGNAINSSPSFNTSQNYYKNNQNGVPINNQVKRTVIKEVIKKGAQAYGIPEPVTEKILETNQGKGILDAASNAKTPTEGAAEIFKVVAKKQLISILPTLILPIFLLLLVAGLFMGKLAVSGLGESKSDVYEELEKEIARVARSYGTVNIDEELIFATLVSYKGDEVYSEDSVTFKDMNHMKNQVDKLARFQIMTTKKCKYDSTTIRQIASNDGLFTEDNYNCVPDMEENDVIYTVSTSKGEYDDDTSGGVFFWNLVDEDFIFDYYNDYMINQKVNTSENDEKIREIIDHIYMFYELMDKSSYSSVPLCSDGITVDGVTVDLEEYVKGVVYAEIGSSDMPIEAIKAISVSIRSNVLSTTNSCTRELHSSTSGFTYQEGYESNFNVTQAVDETKGQYLVQNGQIFSAVYTSFPDLDSECNVVCDNSYCSADLSYDYDGKLGNHTVRVPRYENGVDIANDGVGSCKGMSKYAIVTDALNGDTYDKILNNHYSSVVETVYPATKGLVNDNGFLKRVERAQRDNLYYYAETNDYSNGYISGGLEGECAWYAVKRTNEIIATMGLQDMYNYVSNGGNGRDFCYASDYKQFEKSTNVNDPTLKAGAIVSWYDDSYGHVAVVEAVYRDSNGNITSIDVSEASIGFGQYGRNARTIINNSSSQTLERRENCEGNGSGCQHFKNISINNIENLYGQQQFICYLKIVK